MKKLVALTLTAVFLTSPAFGASFNCEKAGTRVEHLICDNPDLSSADESMSAFYKEALDALYRENKEYGDIEVSNQKLWLEDRNTCESENCLAQAYESRTLQLQHLIETSKADAERKALVSSQSSAPDDEAFQESGALEQVQDSAPESHTQVSAPSVEAAKDSSSLEQREKSPSKGMSLYSWFVLITLGVVVLGVGASIYGYKSRCPSCKKWFSEKTAGRELIDQRQGFETVTRQDQHKNSRGEVIKTVERQEQVQVVTSTYNVHHRCQNCAHEWTTVEVAKS